MSDRLLPHQILGRYQLLVPVARGGMGQVWLGRLQGARGFSKLVAIKTVLPNEDDRARLEAMLAEEARLAVLVEHANVVHTIELGEQGGVLYLVMEWVDGEPLGNLQARAEERGGMPIPIAVSLVAQVLDGLHAAHELRDDSGPLGVVHRDVSPHNVLVTYEGVAKLLDFGIAKATEQSSGHTELGEIKGKFSYMSPEQILGEDVDRRCDVFAAGIVLYWLTTGRHPFKHASTAAVIHAITSPSPVPPPSSVVSGFPAELEQVLQKALAKAREERFATAEEMRGALERAMPDAFGDAGRSALAAYVTDVVGERRAARREAIRRAQLAADGARISSSSALMVAPSQSASSLGAISLSQPAPEADSSRSTPSTSVTAPKRREPLAPRVAAIAGVLLALSSLLPRLLAGPSRATATATGAPSGASLMVVEPTRAAASTSAPAIATAPASEPPPIAASAKRAPPRVAKVKPLARAKAPGPSSADLLAPDY